MEVGSSLLIKVFVIDRTVHLISRSFASWYYHYHAIISISFKLTVMLSREGRQFQIFFRRHIIIIFARNWPWH